MTIKAWAGISDNEIDITKEYYTKDRILAIFTNRKTAESHYEYVLPCEIIINLGGVKK